MIGYFSFEGFENELQEEIKFFTDKKATQYGRLFLFDQDVNLIWAQLKLTNIQIADVESISKAATLLKSQQKLWAHDSFHFHRRSELIQEQLRTPKNLPLEFLQKLPDRDWGFWCLLEEKKLLYCNSTGNPFPLGEIKFHEDKQSPPSRAYLKLWEVFTAHLSPPEKGSRVLDLGSCPGGWTWVLQSLGCHVVSVDKAPLDEKVARLKNIEYIKKDAFKLDPASIKNPQWLFSDIICEPSRLLELVNHWREVHPELNFVCTIKYKGSTDFKTTEQFLKIPGSHIVHLVHNKHEVTWICQSGNRERIPRFGALRS